jgi:4-aminobutyrate--pyruvate transaminase
LRTLGGHALVGEARGIGLVGAVELVQNKDSKAAFDSRHAVGGKCMAFCQERGLIVRAIGDSIAICPPFIVQPTDIDDIFDRLGDGLNDTLAWAQQNKLV